MNNSARLHEPNPLFFREIAVNDYDATVPEDLPDDEVPLNEELQIILPPRCDDVTAESSVTKTGWRKMNSKSIAIQHKLIDEVYTWHVEVKGAQESYEINTKVEKEICQAAHVYALDFGWSHSSNLGISLISVINYIINLFYTITRVWTWKQQNYLLKAIKKIPIPVGSLERLF